MVASQTALLLQRKYPVAEPLLHRLLTIMEKADPENTENSLVVEQQGQVCQAERWVQTILM